MLVISNLLTYWHYGKKRLEALVGYQKQLESQVASQSAELTLMKEIVNNLSQKTSNLNETISNLSQETSRSKEDAEKLDKELQDSKAKLEKEAAENREKLEKQEACNKANELSQIPGDMVFRNSGSQEGCGPSNFSHIPSSTEGALEYIQGFLQNYRNTGSYYWRHNPDICLQDAGNNHPILEERYNKYLYYKKICEE